MLKIHLPDTMRTLFDLQKDAGRYSQQILIGYGQKNAVQLSIQTNSQLIKDIAVFTIELKCDEYVRLVIEATTPIRIMDFALSGLLHIKDAKGRHHKLIEHKHHGLMIPDNQSTAIYAKGDIKLFVVIMASGMLKKLVPQQDRLFLKDPAIRFITLEMEELIHTVAYGDEQLSQHRVLLVSKALQLLFLDLEQLKNNMPLSINHKSDLHKLEKARQLIAQNLQTPYSLIELARHIGLNDFKLKKEFKETYGNTVFGYLADLRMEKARSMLSTSRYTVSEVAHEVGYKNAHHFTAAFKKKFGYLPSKINGVA